MTIKDQFKQGLQWGGCAWLGWIAWQSLLNASHCHLYPEDFLVSFGWCAHGWLLAAAWIVALALTWTRWSRAGVAGAIAMQAFLGTAAAAHYGGPMPLWWVLTFWLPMSLPLVPLLFMQPERPRLTVALLLLGRWREGLATLGGWRWPFAAAGVFLLNRVGWIALSGYYAYLWAIISALFFVIAAFPAVAEKRTGAPVEG